MREVSEKKAKKKILKLKVDFIDEVNGTIAINFFACYWKC